MATFGEYKRTVVTRDSPCCTGFLAQLQRFEGPRLRTRDNTCLPDT